MSTQELVCPRCGTPAGTAAYCANCGLELGSYQLLTPLQWQAQQATAASHRVPTPEAAGPVATPPPPPPPSPPPPPAAQPPQRPAAPPVIGLVGLSLGAGGALIALAASFLPWYSFFGIHRNLWQVSKFEDIALLLLVLALVGMTIPALVLPRVRVLRILALALGAAVLSFVFIPPIEAMVAGKSSAVKAGEIVSLLAAVILFAAVALQAVAARSPAPPRPGTSPFLIIGLVLLAVVGILDPLIALLPLSHDTSFWELSKIADILDTLVDLTLVALALTAILLPRATILSLVAFVIGCYMAVGLFVGGVESFAYHERGAAIVLELILLVPLAVAGSALVGVFSPAIRQRA